MRHGRRAYNVRDMHDGESRAGELLRNIAGAAIETMCAELENKRPCSGDKKEERTDDKWKDRGIFHQPDTDRLFFLHSTSALSLSFVTVQVSPRLDASRRG
jgi:hypothetical protein